MATFKVGQRVRVRLSHPAVGGREAIVAQTQSIPGAVIAPGCQYAIDVPSKRSHHPLGFWSATADELVPLTDPGAEKFIASLEKLGREPVIKMHPVPFGD